MNYFDKSVSEQIIPDREIIIEIFLLSFFSSITIYPAMLL